MYTVHIVHSHKTFDDGAYTYCHKEYGHSIGRMVIGCILYTVYWYSVYCIHSHRACIHGTYDHWAYGYTNSNANRAYGTWSFELCETECDKCGCKDCKFCSVKLTLKVKVKLKLKVLMKNKFSYLVEVLSLKVKLEVEANDRLNT